MVSKFLNLKAKKLDSIQAASIQWPNPMWFDYFFVKNLRQTPEPAEPAKNSHGESNKNSVIHLFRIVASSSTIEL